MKTSPLGSSSVIIQWLYCCQQIMKISVYICYVSLLSLLSLSLCLPITQTAQCLSEEPSELLVFVHLN